MRYYKKVKNSMLLAALPLAAVCCDNFCQLKDDQSEEAKGNFRCQKRHTAPFGDGWCKEVGCPFSRTLPP